MQKALLGAVAALAMTLPLAAEAAFTETFQNLGNDGDAVSDGTAVFGGLGTVSRVGTNAGRGLALYDTSGNGGQDPDLEYADSGLALILQVANDPPPADDDAGGGTFRFDFVGGTVQDLLGFSLFDVEDGETVKVVSDKGDIVEVEGTADEKSGSAQTAASTVTFDFTGTGSVTNADILANFPFNTANAQGISWFEIQANGVSTALDDVVVTPLPAAAWMMISGLAAVGGITYRRRQKAAAA